MIADNSTGRTEGTRAIPFGAARPVAPRDPREPTLSTDGSRRPRTDTGVRLGTYMGQDRIVMPGVNPVGMREVLGHFLSGLTVITAILDGEPVGFTCQSFTSLSLEPALVSFAPSRTSTSWPKVRRASSFCINVLSEEQVGVSHALARSGTDKFAGLSWRPSMQGAPVLEGVAAFIDATVWAEYDGGDHTIVAARVLDLGADSSRRPLLFHRGGYGLRE